MPVIEVQGLRKEYRAIRRGATVALDGLDFTVPEGGVFGFLGPNGSGKTTTIRCLLGLATPSAGSARILGADPQRDLASVIRRVGSIVEAPALFPGYSGRRNLRFLGGLYGIGDRRVDEVLDVAGLTARADDLVKTYSLGMRQRLAIAAALLKDPELLILDEPANGLDPSGIREVRELMRRLGDEGRTVFVSSHLLAEVQQTCDHVAILTRGRCVASGPVDDVLRSRHAARLIVRLDDVHAGLAVLQAAGVPAALDDGVIRVDVPAEGAGRISEILGRKKLWVTELRPEVISLEDVFLELTEGQGLEVVSA